MIAITGHANGIGKSLFEKYPGSIGFDLSNGYNIDSDIERIIAESNHCNVFINNAYYYNRQTDLLDAWYKQHKDDKFIIVNISSVAADPNLDIKNTLPHLSEYADQKRNLNKLSFDINQSNSRCKSIVIMPGIVDTNLVTPYDENVDQIGIEYFTKIKDAGHLLNTSDVVAAVDIAIQSFNARSFISSITISNL